MSERHGAFLNIPAERVAELEPVARIMADAADRQRWIDDPPSELMPITLQEAYLVQELAAKLRHDVPNGWKIGATSASAQRMFDVSEPFVGRVFRNDIHASPAVVLRVRPDMLVVEGEFAFLLGADLPPRPEPYERNEVIAAIATLHPAIEYVQSRYLTRGKPDVLKTVADNAAQGGLILGSGIADWKHLDLPRTGVRIFVGEREVASGNGAEALGDPVNCLQWLANFLRRRSIGLSAGEVVTTGTCTMPIEIPANSRILAHFDQCGTVSATLSVPMA